MAHVGAGALAEANTRRREELQLQLSEVGRQISDDVWRTWKETPGRLRAELDKQRAATRGPIETWKSQLGRLDEARTALTEALAGASIADRAASS